MTGWLTLTWLLWDAGRRESRSRWDATQQAEMSTTVRGVDHHRTRRHWQRRQSSKSGVRRSQIGSSFRVIGNRDLPLSRCDESNAFVSSTALPLLLSPTGMAIFFCSVFGVSIATVTLLSRTPFPNPATRVGISVHHSESIAARAWFGHCRHGVPVHSPPGPCLANRH